MLHNPGGSGGVSLRNYGENQSFRKRFIYHLQSGVYICDIYHLANIGKMAPLVCIYIHKKLCLIQSFSGQLLETSADKLLMTEANSGYINFT